MAAKSCYLCGSTEHRKREGAVRDAPGLDVLECCSCGLVFLSSFSHIDEDFYRQARMHKAPPDVQSWLKETAWDDQRRFSFLQRAIENRNVLDFGCGAGGFLLRARTAAATVAGVELERRLQPHFKKHGLKVYASSMKVPGRFDLITLFHVLEHLADPAAALEELAGKLDAGGQIVVEVPSSDDVLLKLYGSSAFSRFTYWSCHLFLFNTLTLTAVARRAGLKVDFIKQVQRYPLSNHLHWLSKGSPGGHMSWSFLDSEELHRAYEKQLASLGLCDTVIAGFSRLQAYEKKR